MQSVRQPDSQAFSQPVSIVVTVLNEAADIARGVASLLAQQPSSTEVIVVDGGSSDGTWEWLAGMQAKEPRLVAIRDQTCNLKHSAGPVSRGRNVAIAAAKTGIIACADAGCTYAPDWLANLTGQIAAGEAEYDSEDRVLTPSSTPYGTSRPLRSLASSYRRTNPPSHAQRDPWPSPPNCGGASADSLKMY